jgi:DNA-binding MarR family transcriptional regulator
MPPKQPLENLGFMLQDVARLMRVNYNRRAQAQWRALTILLRNPGMWQCHLADALETKPISAARLIDRMEAAGWVERRADPKDRRAIQLYLTKQSEPIMAALKKHGAACRGCALDGISVEEQEKFLDILMRMRGNMTAASEEQEKTAAAGG